MVPVVSNGNHAHDAASAAGAIGGYVRLQRPRAAVVDVRRPGPAAFHVAMMRRALNHGLPAKARLAPLRTRLARADLPTELAARMIRRRSGEADEQLDGVLHAVSDAWADLAAEARLLDAARRPRPDELCLLGVERSEGRTLFIFEGDQLEPCLVLTASASQARRNEADAQAQAAAVDVAPRHLGRVGDHLVQEGVGGLALWIDSDPTGLVWPESTLASVDQIHDRLTVLASGTAQSGRPGHLDDVFAALDRTPLDASLLRRVRAVQRDLDGLDVQVLEHCDMSAQNVTVTDDGAVTGIIDWEFARADGVVGFDHLLLAISLAEHGLGRWTWSDEAAYTMLADGWDDAPIFTRARTALRRSLEACTGSDALAPQLEVAHMVERLTGAYRSGASPQVSQETLMRSLRLVLGR